MTTNRLDVLWPFAIIAAAAFWILRLVGTIPPTLVDIINRAWPVALVAFALILLLGRRVRFGNLIALGLSAVLVAGLSSLAYGRQASRPIVAATPQTVDQAVAAEMTGVKIRVNALLTEIVIQPNPTGQRVISAEFLGSSANKLVTDYQIDGTAATFNLNETQQGEFVPLESIGTGKMTLSLPVGVTIDELTIAGNTGDLTVDASSTTIKTLSLATSGGNIKVILPQTVGLIGDVKTGRGAVTLVVPKTIAAQITLRGGATSAPEYASSEYILTRDNVLISQRAPTDPQMQITVDSTERASIQ